MNDNIKEMEELTADLAMAIEKGFKHWSDSNYWESRFVCEVQSPMEIVVTDQNDQQYKITVEKINN